MDNKFESKQGLEEDRSPLEEQEATQGLEWIQGPEQGTGGPSRWNPGPEGGVGGPPRWNPEPDKKGGFAKGILVGAVGTLVLLVLVTVVVTSAFGIFAGNGTDRNTQAQSGSDGETITSGNLLNADLLSQVSVISAYLDQYFLYDVDVEELRTGMLQGLTEALGDPYAQYYDEEALRSFQDSTQGEYVGIGAAVTQELSTGIVRISQPYEGTPSAEAGLLPGDMLVSVDGTEVTGMELDQVVTLIKGEEGTTVTLHIYRESEEQYLDIEVERRKVEIPTVSSEMLDDNIGYIEVTGFEQVTTQQFINAYEELKAQGMERVIVDLRNNGGGLVETVEGMLDYLLPEGEIFYVKYKDGTKDMEYSSDEEAALDIPMVVLVNEYTASASEIFAGNIQAFGLGQVVGTTTYGKGVMQQLFYTNEERTAGIKLTVADYYIHGDKNVNDVGIVPDVEVELSEEAASLLDIPLEQDNQLQTAIETVQSQ